MYYKTLKSHESSSAVILIHLIYNLIQNHDILEILLVQNTALQRRNANRNSEVLLCFIYMRKINFYVIIVQ